jgi:4-amino-4-deoxy-L-arabinose transferase-like glycosyltransferase
MRERNWAAAPLAVILLVALVVRLGYLYWYLEEPRPVQGDGYPQIALSILTGHGFAAEPLRLNWFRTPGYPLFIAAVWTVVPPGARYVALLLAQVGVSVATCGVLFLVASAAFDRRAALTGASLLALSPSGIIETTLILPESLQLFWIALAAFSAVRLYQGARLRWAILLGLFWGAAGLTRPEATYLLAPLVLPVLAAAQQPVFARLSACAAAVLAKIAVMAPWVARNYMVYGTFVLHVPVGALAFAGVAPPDLFGPDIVVPIGSYESDTGRPSVEGMPEPEISDRILILRNEPAILEVNRKLATYGMTKLAERKTKQVLYNMGRNGFILWGRPAAWFSHWGVDLPAPLARLWLASHASFLGLFALGVCRAWKTKRLGAVPLSWLLLVAGHTAVFLVLYATCRYQVTSTIFVTIYSGLGASLFLPKTTAVLS